MSSDVFQIFCKSCGSKLNAKASLIGQTRNCPKCQSPILIQREDATSAQQTARETPQPMSPTGAPVGSTSIIVNEPAITDRVSGPALGDGMEPVANLPERLQFRNRYLILNDDRIIALWETGKGWQVNVGGGFSSAKKNVAAIPDQGSFLLIELIIGSMVADSMIGGGPTGVNVFKISQRGALMSLYRDESEILEKVDCVGELSKSQKSVLMTYLRQNFMFESLAGSQELLDYLAM